jgi:hypothetical protein
MWYDLGVGTKKVKWMEKRFSFLKTSPKLKHLPFHHFNIPTFATPFKLTYPNILFSEFYIHTHTLRLRHHIPEIRLRNLKIHVFKAAQMLTTVSVPWCNTSLYHFSRKWEFSTSYVYFELNLLFMQ